MSSRCDECKYKDNAEFHACYICTMEKDMFLQKSKPTNAERLRAMTDKELAEWISEEKITGCPEGLFYTEITCKDMACFDCWFDWLKREAE